MTTRPEDLWELDRMVTAPCWLEMGGVQGVLGEGSEAHGVEMGN